MSSLDVELARRIAARVNAATDYEKTHIIVSGIESDLESNPSDFGPYYRLAEIANFAHQYSEALEAFNIAMRKLESEHASVPGAGQELESARANLLRDRAQLLATCPDSQIRDGPAAVRDATTAADIAQQTGQYDGAWRQRHYLGTLAAAHAEAGDFDKAIYYQKEFLAIAVTRRNQEFALRRLRDYESGIPGWRLER